MSIYNKLTGFLLCNILLVSVSPVWSYQAGLSSGSSLKKLKEFEDTKGVIRIRKSKKNRQHNGQKKKDKQRSTKDTYKTSDTRRNTLCI